VKPHRTPRAAGRPKAASRTSAPKPVVHTTQGHRAVASKANSRRGANAAPEQFEDGDQPMEEDGAEEFVPEAPKLRKKVNPNS
jgi:hypothetical protein